MLHAEYSWVHAITGGVLIGAASLIAAAASGKIPGISGLFSRILGAPAAGETGWRIAFFLGLIAGAAVAFTTLPAATAYGRVTSLPGAVLAGLLVGLGTRVGRGCTSGHGVCGIGLGSKSSIAATLMFIAAGIATVTLLRVTGFRFWP